MSRRLHKHTHTHPHAHTHQLLLFLLLAFECLISGDQEFRTQWMCGGVYQCTVRIRTTTHKNIICIESSGIFTRWAKAWGAPAVRENHRVSQCAVCLVYVLSLLFSFSHNFTNQNENLSLYCLEKYKNGTRKYDRKCGQCEKGIESASTRRQNIEIGWRVVVVVDIIA